AHRAGLVIASATMLRVRVPASSANLGPGFDALGMALGLYLEVTARPSATDGFTYDGAGPVTSPEGNLIHSGYRAAYQELGQKAPAVTLSVVNPIPLARGLGSSSTALVAGAAIAD